MGRSAWSVPCRSGISWSVGQRRRRVAYANVDCVERLGCFFALHLRRAYLETPKAFNGTSVGGASVTRSIFLYLLAVVVPVVAIWFASPSTRSAYGLAVSPYAWPSLIVVHCLAAIPLAVLLGDWLRNKSKWVNPVPLVVGGMILSGIAYGAMGSIGESLEGVGFGLRCVVRSLLGLLLATPFVMAARVEVPVFKQSWLSLGVGLVVGLVLPGVWAEKLTSETVPLMSIDLAKGRLVRASRHLEALLDLAPDRNLPSGSESRTLTEIKRRLNADLARVSERVSSPPKESAKWAEKIEYANDLVSLDRLEDAEKVLVKLSANPVAQRKLSEVYQLQKRYPESDAVLRSFLSEGLPRTDKPAVRIACIEAFDALANNAAEQRHYNQVEAILNEAIEKLPNDEAHFRYELGLHYKMRNRPLDATRELNEAIRIDGTLAPVAEPLIRNLKEQTPACLVGR